MWSGTTGVACQELNRNFIGIELYAEYYDIAKQRINEAKTQGAINMSDERFTMDWHCCKFMCFKENRSYCELKEEWCRARDCKEQMIE